ncbi:MAG: hypothetical protein EOO20_07250 [Chryseobacterium sp.]|nr:MAG: hypothetical protein EOO20_07250 [Chryseobacterium sp.]
MSFNDKIDQFFSSFDLSLGDAPTRNLIYLYADYVELISLFSNQNYVSASDITDRFKDEGIIRQAKKDQDQAEQNDEKESLVDEIFRLLNERSLLFADDYPFLIYNTDKIILKKDNAISKRNKIYIFLLLSSSLNIFRLFQPELTSEFELLCVHVLKNYLPKHAIVKSFGKNSEYSGTAKEKIRALAKDLRIRIDEEGFLEISEKGNQEKGLDLIGWIGFDDQVANYISVLAQCACGKDWDKKLHETARYNNYMAFHRLVPVHSMFIPYNLVSYNKVTFFRSTDISADRLIFERKRILNYLNEIDFFDDFKSIILVDKCIEFEESIV